MKTLMAAMLILLMTVAPLAAAQKPGSIPIVELPVRGSQLVTFRIQFGVGAIDDPSGKMGLTQLTASMLANAGTAKRSYSDLIDLMYPMAADVRSLVEMEVTTISGTVHADNLPAFYDLLVETLLEPGFRAEDFTRIQQNQSNAISKSLRGSNDEEFGKQALSAFMYAGHAYGTPVLGRVSNVEAITLDQVRDHYQKYFTRNNVTIAIAGGYALELPARLQKDLSRLPAGTPKRVVPGKPRPIRNIEVLAVEKETRATAISMGFPLSITRADADFYPLMIANSYLGEHRTFNGQLMIRMRQVRGLNYGDYSYIENFIQEGGSTFPLVNIPRHQQFFGIWIRPVQPEHRHFAVRLALWELDKLIRDGMSAEDFEATRQFLTNYSKLWAQDQGRRLGYQMDSRFYGTDDFLETLPQKLAAVTLEQVNAAVRRHLTSRNLCIAVVTKGADDFLNDLIDNKPSPISYQSTMPEDVVAEDRLVAEYRLTINRTDSKVVHADEMFK